MKEAKGRLVLFYVGTEAEFIKLYPVITKCVDFQMKMLIVCNGQNDISSSPLMIDKIRDKCIFLLRDKIKFPFKNFALRSIWLFVWSIANFIKSYSYFRMVKGRESRLPVLIVHGDTVSTFIGSIIGWICSFKIIHIESGLSSGHLFDPFPEEICRRVVTKISTLRLCPSVQAFNAVPDAPGKSKLLTNGNTMWDMIQVALNNLNGIPKSRHKYFVLVIHRQETLSNPEFFFKILSAIKKYRTQDLECIFVMHPQTKNLLAHLKKFDEVSTYHGWKLVDRLPFIEFIGILKDAQFVLTDGGTNQEECHYLGIPCYLLRRCTERNEGLGENVVLPENVIENIQGFINSYKKFRKPPVFMSVSPSDLAFNAICESVIS